MDEALRAGESRLTEVQATLQQRREELEVGFHRNCKQDADVAHSWGNLSMTRQCRPDMRHKNQRQHLQCSDTFMLARGKSCIPYCMPTMCSLLQDLETQLKQAKVQRASQPAQVGYPLPEAAVPSCTSEQHPDVATCASDLI